jgi:hypothetical protein
MDKSFLDSIGMNAPFNSDLDLLPTLFSFTICILMSFIVRAFYGSRAFSLTGKTHIASILPLLSGIIFMIIVVVKSSLALSLGLVGALSVVRFRTPIKEPEDLVYLFLAIALGIGYGANQILVTTTLAIAVLCIAYFWLSNRSGGATNEYNLVVTWESPSIGLNAVSQQVENIAESVSLVRYDNGPRGNTAVFLVLPIQGKSLDDVLGGIRAIDATAGASFFEARANY